MPSQRQLMEAGEWYSCLDDELEALRQAARRAVHAHNSLDPDSRGPLAPTLAALLGSAGEGVFVEAPVHVAYGINLHLGARVYVNAGCVILDSAPVRIGTGCLLGPNVSLLCLEHATDPAARAAGLEIARPITLGPNAWIGGGATILGGVTVGEDAIVGAGAVVTRDVPSGATVVGNPARARG